MSQMAHAAASHVASTALTQNLGLWARIKSHCARINAAHARQARFSPQMAEISRDIGCPVEVLLGESAFDPALPFFFQHNFGRD